MNTNLDYVYVKNMLDFTLLKEIRKSNPIQILNVLIDNEDLYLKYKDNEIIKEVIQEYSEQPLLFHEQKTFKQLKEIKDKQINKDNDGK